MAGVLSTRQAPWLSQLAALSWGTAHPCLEHFHKKVFLGASTPVATSARAALCHQALQIKGAGTYPAGATFQRGMMLLLNFPAQPQLLLGVCPCPVTSYGAQPCSSPSKMFLEPSFPTILNHLLDSLIFIISVLLPS